MHQINSCNRLLRKLLGNMEYRNLTNFTLKEVNNKFKLKSKLKTKRIVKINNAYVLILTLTQSKRLKPKSFNKVKINNKINSKYLVGNDIDSFIKKYSYYINLLKNKIENY